MVLTSKVLAVLWFPEDFVQMQIDVMPVYDFQEILSTLKCIKEVNSMGKVGLLTLRDRGQRVTPAQ